MTSFIVNLTLASSADEELLHTPAIIPAAAIEYVCLACGSSPI